MKIVHPFTKFESTYATNIYLTLLKGQLHIVMLQTI